MAGGILLENCDFWRIETPSLRIGATKLIGIHRYIGELMRFGMYGE